LSHSNNSNQTGNGNEKSTPTEGQKAFVQSAAQEASLPPMSKDDLIEVARGLLQEFSAVFLEAAENHGDCIALLDNVSGDPRTKLSGWQEMQFDQLRASMEKVRVDCDAYGLIADLAAKDRGNE